MEIQITNYKDLKSTFNNERNIINKIYSDLRRMDRSEFKNALSKGESILTPYKLGGYAIFDVIGVTDERVFLESNSCVS